MASFTVDISPDVLVWARRSNGLSIEEAARRIDVSVTELRMWEEGAEDPSIEQLRRVAKAYKYPLAVMLLQDPPSGVQVLRDFRLLPANQGRDWSPELRRQFRRLQYQQQVARDVASATGEVPRYVLPALTMGEAPEHAGSRIDSWLREEASTSSHDRPSFSEWVMIIEKKGVLVTQVEGVSVGEMRGCSISSRPFPIVALNGKDSTSGKLFTLMHELVHVLLDEEALCDLGPVSHKSPASVEQIERFCDEVSAAILMPSHLLLSDPAIRQANARTEWTVDQLQRFAAPFHVSAESMLRRLVTLGKTSMDYYWEMRPYFARLYREIREKEEAKLRESTGGPSPYLLKIRNLGHRFVADVLEAYEQDLIEPSDVSDYLDIKVNHIPNLIARMGV